MTDKVSIDEYEKEIIRVLAKFIKFYIVHMEREIPAEKLGVDPKILEALEKLNLVERVGYDYYRLKRPSLVAKILVRKGRINELFPLIEGHDDIKRFIARSFFERGINVLLVGPPASGKTLFLETIYVLNQDIGVYVDATQTTAAGLRDLLYQRKPEILCIDELDKPYDKKLYNTLANILEFGKVIVTKYKEHHGVSLRLNVYASANEADRLPSFLLDRFLRFNLQPYSIDEIYRICLKALVNYEIITDEELARTYLDVMIKDVGIYSIRDILKLAKFVTSKKDIEFVKRIATKYIVRG